jgi:hypothetical protein
MLQALDVHGNTLLAGTVPALPSGLTSLCVSHRPLRPPGTAHYAPCAAQQQVCPPESVFRCQKCNMLLTGTL